MLNWWQLLNFTEFHTVKVPIRHEYWLDQNLKNVIFNFVCLFLFFVFAGKSKQLEEKMVQQLQEDVDMGDEDN